MPRVPAGVVVLETIHPLALYSGSQIREAKRIAYLLHLHTHRDRFVLLTEPRGHSAGG